MTHTFNQAIHNCIVALQDNDGHCNYFSTNTFYTSLILNCLSPTINNSHNGAHCGLITKGLDFLLYEKSSLWTWNYWQRESDKNKLTPCPDDLDDTSMALAALSIHRKEKVTGEALSCLTKVLMNCEIKAGGPYNTWILSKPFPDTWTDVDIVVNSNIAYLLSLHDIYLPNLEEIADTFISSGTYTSKYYFNPLSVYYFISRSYKGNLKQKAINAILTTRKEDDSWGNILDTSLALSALIHFGADIKNLSQSFELLETYALKNKWESIPLYMEENKGESTYGQSPALTTAFVLEALTKYEKVKTSTIKKEDSINNTGAERIKNSILKRAEDKWSTLSPEVSTPLRILSQKVIQTDTSDQILLLPFYFSQCLDTKNKILISEEHIITLGLANLYGWMAYKIYDDILDDEGNPLLLPAANILLREMTLLFKDLLPSQSFSIFTNIMDTLDEANTWERAHCRDTALLPDYGDHNVLAQKSLGHALGPLTLLSLLGYKPESFEITQTRHFFHHYIIARQLNDDAHDWLEDFRRGFINSTSTLILNKTLSRKEETLQEIFCYEVLETIATKIQEHVSSARDILTSLTFLSHPEYLYALLEPLERAALTAQSEKIKTEEFLTYFSQNP